MAMNKIFDFCEKCGRPQPVQIVSDKDKQVVASFCRVCGYCTSAEPMENGEKDGDEGQGR